MKSKLIRTRQNGGLVLDFKNDFMKIKFNNVINQLNDNQLERKDNYNFNSSPYYFTFDLVQTLPQEIEQTNSINSEFNILGSVLYIDASYSKSSLYKTTDDYNFEDQTGAIFVPSQKQRTDSVTPQELIHEYYTNIKKANDAITSINQTVLNSIDRQVLNTQDVTKRMTIDWKIPFTFFDNILSGFIKLGGKYSYKLRSNNNFERQLPFDNSGVGQDNQKDVFDRYFQNFNGHKIITDVNGALVNQGIPGANFGDPGYKTRSILNGQYHTLWSPNLNLLQYFTDSVLRGAAQEKPQSQYQSYFEVQAVGSYGNNFSTDEELKAGYIMAVIDIGKKIKLFPGVRFEDENTTYNGVYAVQSQIAGGTGLALGPIPETTKRHNDNFFPSLNAKYDITDWMSLRGAYYRSCSRPDYNLLSPSLATNQGNHTQITLYNPFLQPAIAQNVDLEVLFYSNKLGLLTLYGYFKKIDGYVYQIPSFYTQYIGNVIGAPNSVNQALEVPYKIYPQSYFLTGEQINNGMPVNIADPAYVEGAEIAWQTNLWFLPGLFKGIVLDINGTLIESQSKLPYFKIDPSGTAHYATSEHALIEQPKFLANVRVGYDYKGFSARISLRYTDKIVNSIDPTYSVNNAFGIPSYYLDFTMKQKIYKGLSLTYDWINITNFEGTESY